jgi:hypothetical protein
MIVESRCYTLHPGKLHEYLACFTAPGVLDLLGPRIAGFWFSESGTLNQVHHLWRYESRADRAAVRAGWPKLPAMAEFFSRAMPLLQRQRSHVMSGEVLQAPDGQGAGVFDRISLCFQPQAGAAAEGHASALGQCLAAQFQRVATLRRLRFESAGPLAEVQFVLRSDSLAQRDGRWRGVEGDLSRLAASPLLASLDSQLLLAAPFSPWR